MVWSKGTDGPAVKWLDGELTEISRSKSASIAGAASEGGPI